LIFTSTTGRSGTRYLANLINTNALNATAEHDPYPRGYGKPIYWYENGETDRLRRLVIHKLKRLERGKNRNIYNKPILRGFFGRKNSQTRLNLPFNKIFRGFVPTVDIKDIYLESTHAFLKSYAEMMISIKPDISLIHLTRDPLEVAKSFFNRSSIPGPNNPYLLDPDFKNNKIKISKDLTDFQKCLWYWFESEIRHSIFLEKYDIKHVYDIDLNELNKKESVKKLFNEFGIKYNDILLDVNRNENINPTKITDKDLSEASELISLIPEDILKKLRESKGVNKLLNF
jgi:hypothetical protein